MPAAAARKNASGDDNHSHQPTKPIPVTIITGFLGSGKTTLLSHILQSQTHGRRIAVINNEFSQDVKVGTSNEMSVSSSPADKDKDKAKAEPALSVDIYETKGGCLCCGGGGDDFRRILHELLHHRSKYDYVVVETTGMADPAFSKLFFLDLTLKANYFIDGFVTVVDGKHGMSQLAGGPLKPLSKEDEEDGLVVINEAWEQLAIADRVLINKVDLATPAELQALETKIKSVNPTAQVYRTKYSEVDLDKILSIQAFDLARVEARDKHFLMERPQRVHDQLIESVALVGDGALPSAAAFKSWLQSELHKYQVLRSKGFVHIRGQQERCVFQAVRALVDVSKGPAWPTAQSDKPENPDLDDRPCHRLVLIGPSIRQHKEAIVHSFLSQFNPGPAGTGQEQDRVRLKVYYPGGDPLSWKEFLLRLLLVGLVLLLLLRAQPAA